MIIRAFPDSDSEDVEDNVDEAVLKRLQLLKLGSGIESISASASMIAVEDDPDASVVSIRPKFETPALTEYLNDIDEVDRQRRAILQDARRENESVDCKLAEMSSRRKARVAEIHAAKQEIERQRLERERKAQEEAARLAELKRQEELKKAEEIRRAEEARQAAAKAAKDAELARAKAAEEARKREEAVKAEKLRKEAEEKQQQEKEEAQKAAAKAQAAEQEKQAAAERAAAQRAAEEEKLKGSRLGSDFKVITAEYEAHMKVIQYAKTQLNPPVSADPQLKKHASDIKSQLRPKVGQLTNSRAQLLSVLEALKQVVHQAKASGDLLYKWTLNILAKIIAKQGESESNVAAEAAVPVAMVSTLLWAEFPEFGEFLIARFVKKCPHVIGYRSNLDTEEGRKRMGYLRTDGRWESEVNYNERMAGIVGVWAAITQSKISPKMGKKHPYPISHSWVFLARHLNVPAADLRDVDFAVISMWWDITAMRFQEAFGRQADKLLRLACTGLVDAANDKKLPASNRLRLQGEDWRRTGKLTPVWKPLDP